MNRVIDKANQIIQQYGTDLDQIAESLGLDVLQDKFEGKMKEIYFPGYIVLDEKVSVRERRELIAHALCHHLLHAGNHWSQYKRIYSFGNHHEKQADVFAACLLMPRDAFERYIRTRPRLDEIANHFQVTEKLAKLRLLIWANFERDQSDLKINVNPELVK